ncbi:MAG: hypothetical protein AAB110_02915 [Candidatus Desantisbacteria bacterium]
MTTLREKLQQDSDELLLDALAETAAIAKGRIINDKDFSVENVIPLLLLSQYNHIAHLDADVTGIKQELKDSEQRLEQKMDERFEKIDKRFEKIDERFEKIDKRFEKMDERFVEIYKSILDIHHQISNQTKWIFGMGVGIVAILGGLITFLNLG